MRALLSSHAVTQEAASAGRTCLALSVLPVLLTSDGAQDDFAAAGGVETLASLLDRWTGVPIFACLCICRVGGQMAACHRTLRAGKNTTTGAGNVLKGVKD